MKQTNKRKKQEKEGHYGTGRHFPNISQREKKFLNLVIHSSQANMEKLEELAMKSEQGLGMENILQFHSCCHLSWCNGSWTQCVFVPAGKGSPVEAADTGSVDLYVFSALPPWCLDQLPHPLLWRAFWQVLCLPSPHPPASTTNLLGRAMEPSAFGGLPWRWAAEDLKMFFWGRGGPLTACSLS